MRIRNYFFLAVCVTLLTATVVYQIEDYLAKTKAPSIVVSKPAEPLQQQGDDLTSVQLLASSTTNTTASSTAEELASSTSTPLTLSTSSTAVSSSTKDIEKKPVVPTGPVFKLDVPYYQQQYANSCEASSLRMVLAYYGIKVSDDMNIIQKFGYKPRDKDIVNNEWDNPQEMFVGDVNIIGGTKGYGVYGKPVARTAIDYGRDATYETIITPQSLAKDIKAGYPIILWGYTSLTTSAYTWKLAGGGEVKAFKGEHARVVVGFEGKVDNPTGFFVHDPFNGRNAEYWPLEKLMDQVYAVPGVTNQAVVVK